MFDQVSDIYLEDVENFIADPHFFSAHTKMEIVKRFTDHKSFNLYQPFSIFYPQGTFEIIFRSKRALVKTNLLGVSEEKCT